MKVLSEDHRPGSSPEFLASRRNRTLHTLKMHWGAIYDAWVNTALLLTQSTTTRTVICRQLRKLWIQTTDIIVFVLIAYATWTFYFLINFYYKTWYVLIVILVCEYIKSSTKKMRRSTSKGLTYRIRKFRSERGGGHTFRKYCHGVTCKFSWLEFHHKYALHESQTTVMMGSACPHTDPSWKSSPTINLL